MKRTRHIMLAVSLAASLGLWLWLEQVQRPSPPFDLIEDGLYLGPRVTEPPAGTTAVLNLCAVEDPYTVTTSRWQPIRDAAPASTLGWLEEQVNFIAAQRQQGATVYVHCQNGVSRSGMVVAAYLMREHGWPRDQSLEFLRSKRADVRPIPPFMTLLERWQERLTSATKGKTG